jgi:hypothetical protein
MNTPNVEITKAIAAVMEAVHRLKKDDKNNHGGYKYVSVDDVKDHIRPLLAKNGLEIAINETDYSLESIQGKSGTTVSARFTFELSLRHTSGAESKPDRTTVLLPHTGAQTTGAAKSYALKEWIKGRFLVSTGEKDYIEGGADADAYKQQDYTPAANDAAPVERMGLAEGTPGASKAGNRTAYDTMVKAIRNAPTVKALTDWQKANTVEIDKLPPDWLDELRQEFVDRKAELVKLLAA